MPWLGDPGATASRVACHCPAQQELHGTGTALGDPIEVRWRVGSRVAHGEVQRPPLCSQHHTGFYTSYVDRGPKRSRTEVACVILKGLQMVRGQSDSLAIFQFVDTAPYPPNPAESWVS